MPCQYDKSSDNIFYSKKVQEIKKKKTDMLLLQRFYVYIFTFFLPLLAVIAHYLVT